jgi:hypothetical protein
MIKRLLALVFYASLAVTALRFVRRTIHAARGQES